MQTRDLLLRQLLPGVDVGVLGPLEGPLERLQLLGAEGGAAAARFALQLDARLALRLRILVGRADGAACGAKFATVKFDAFTFATYANYRP
jgi:hypothetical protein